MSALRVPLAVQIPEPAIRLGEVGMSHWKKTITDFGDWQEHELRLLCLACQQQDDIARLTDEVDAERDFKKKRNLRADRRAAANEYAS
jgi:hypothetical protein